MGPLVRLASLRNTPFGMALAQFSWHVWYDVELSTVGGSRGLGRSRRDTVELSPKHSSVRSDAYMQRLWV